MIQDTIKNIIAKQMKVDVTKVKDTTTFEELQADSLDVVEVIMAIESQFSIKLSDEMVESLKTVSELAKYVEELLA